MLDADLDVELKITEITEFCSMVESSVSGPRQWDLFYVPGPVYVPERGLLAAILWMAVHDLSSRVDYLDRISAINWFRGIEPVSLQEYRFSFKDVCLYLDLGETHLRIIRQKLKESIQYEATKPRLPPEEGEFKCTLLPSVPEVKYKFA